MFATPIAKEQVKAADPPVKLPTKRTMLAVRPSYAGLAERAHMLQKSIGNQAMRRYLARLPPVFQLSTYSATVTRLQRQSDDQQPVSAAEARLRGLS